MALMIAATRLSAQASLFVEEVCVGGAKAALAIEAPGRVHAVMIRALNEISASNRRALTGNAPGGAHGKKNGAAPHRVAPFFSGLPNQTQRVGPDESGPIITR